VQHLVSNLEGQGHSMTLQQNLVWPITLLFEVGFYNYFSEMIKVPIRGASPLFEGLLFNLNIHIQVRLM
jgi:hypothetical protein